MKRISHWVDGRSVVGTSGRTGPVYNPALGERVAEVDLASAAEVDAGRAQRAVGDDHALDPGAHEVACGEGVHIAGADHEDGVGAQVRIHAPRQTHGRGGERHRVLADASLRSHAFGR